jgi:hypothetical protein
MKAKTSRTADALRVRMDDPVLISQAGPEVTAWGPYRMPKLFRFPSGELCVTFAVGLDQYADQGMTSPAYLSSDLGRTWRQSTFPHPRLAGMNPIIAPILDGEFYSLPATQGIRLDPARLPTPVGRFPNIYSGFCLYPLDECPADVSSWCKDLNAVRWSPATKRWSDERVGWDHRDQLLFRYDHEGHWTQKVYFESAPVISGRELLHLDYWTCYRTATGAAPAGWESSLMVSSDNARTWRRRSTVMTVIAPDHNAEPVLAKNQSGELVCVIRRTVRLDDDLPMLLVHSRDDGRTWGQPRPLFDFGVFPRLLQLDNGVMVLSFGRPGVWLSFSTDGGHAWSSPQAIIAGERGKSQDHSCGYTSLVATGDDSFLLAYSEFQRPNSAGAPCKSILVRRVTVS